MAGELFHTRSAVAELDRQADDFLKALSQPLLIQTPLQVSY